MKPPHRRSKGRLREAFRYALARFGSTDAKKARIGDPELCAVIREVQRGQVDDLGGGVFKKRLNDNMYRSLILAKGGRNWVYAYLFAKKDGRMTGPEADAAVGNRDLLEICHDH